MCQFCIYTSPRLCPPCVKSWAFYCAALCRKEKFLLGTEPISTWVGVWVRLSPPLLQRGRGTQIQNEGRWDEGAWRPNMGTFAFLDFSHKASKTLSKLTFVAGRWSNCWWPEFHLKQASSWPGKGKVTHSCDCSISRHLKRLQMRPERNTGPGTHLTPGAGVWSSTQTTLIQHEARLF